MKKIILILYSLALLAGCQNTRKATESSKINTNILTKEIVNNLTPDSIITILSNGNREFANKRYIIHDAMVQLSKSAEIGQAPMAIVLSCIDSRVPVETIFNKGLGDLFIARVAGNIVNPDILGSMEYACEHSGAKVVVVLGHGSCGAVHSACNGVETGNITQLLSKIKPAIDSCLTTESDLHSKEFQDKVSHKNVHNMVKNIRKGSPILKDLEDEGKLKIVGAMFDFNNGLIEFFNY